jgi:hypothetical protein
LFWWLVVGLEIADIHRKRGDTNANDGEDANGHPKIESESANDHCCEDCEDAEEHKDGPNDLCCSDYDF